jgi:hypothetical protein
MDELKRAAWWSFAFVKTRQQMPCIQTHLAMIRALQNAAPARVAELVYAQD